MKQKKLLYIFLVLLFQLKVFPQKGYYISSVIQIGMDSGKNPFGSMQVTLGYLSLELLNPMDFIHTAGLTTGFKKIRMVNELKNYEWIGSRYYDIQFHNMENIL